MMFSKSLSGIKSAPDIGHLHKQQPMLQVSKYDNCGGGHGGHNGDYDGSSVMSRQELEGLGGEGGARGDMGGKGKT